MFIPRLLPENPWNSFSETGLTSGLYESISFIISFSEGRFNNLFPGPDLTSKDLRLYSLGDQWPPQSHCQLWLCPWKYCLLPSGRMNFLLHSSTPFGGDEAPLLPPQNLQLSSHQYPAEEDGLTAQPSAGCTDLSTMRFLLIMLDDSGPFTCFTSDIFLWFQTYLCFS